MGVSRLRILHEWVEKPADVDVNLALEQRHANDLHPLEIIATVRSEGQPGMGGIVPVKLWIADRDNVANAVKLCRQRAIDKAMRAVANEP